MKSYQLKTVLQRSSSTTLSTTNMIEWSISQLVAAVDDTTAVLDSCSLKHGSRVSPSVKYEGA